MRKIRKLKSLLICFVLVLYPSSFSNAQEQNSLSKTLADRLQELELKNELSKMQSKAEPLLTLSPMERLAPQQPPIDEWKNGKHSPDAYKVKSIDDDETRLKKQRINVALMEIEHFKRLELAGVETLTMAGESQKRLIRAKLDFHTKPDEIVLVTEQALEFAKTIEAAVRNQYEEGAEVNIQQVGEATFYRLDIEIELLDAKKKLQGAFPNNAQDLPDPDDLSNPRSKPVVNAPQPTVDEWKNGKHSPAVYKIKSSDDEETRLKKQRINVALMETEHFKRLQDAGVETLTNAVDCQKRLLRAKLDFHTKPDEIVLVTEQALEFAKTTEAIVRDQYEEGAEVNIQQVGEATFNRLDIEIQLLGAKKKLQRK